MNRIKVIRGNKIVRVTENELDKYLSKGYVIKEDGGKLSSESTQPTPKVEKSTVVAEEPKADTKQVTKTRRSRKKQLKGGGINVPNLCRLSEYGWDVRRNHF